MKRSARCDIATVAVDEQMEVAGLVGRNCCEPRHNLRSAVFLYFPSELRIHRKSHLEHSIESHTVLRRIGTRTAVAIMSNHDNSQARSREQATLAQRYVCWFPLKDDSAFG